MRIRSSVCFACFCRAVCFVFSILSSVCKGVIVFVGHQLVVVPLGRGRGVNGLRFAFCALCGVNGLRALLPAVFVCVFPRAARRILAAGGAFSLARAGGGVRGIRGGGFFRFEQGGEAFQVVGPVSAFAEGGAGGVPVHEKHGAAQAVGHVERALAAHGGACGGGHVEHLGRAVPVADHAAVPPRRQGRKADHRQRQRHAARKLFAGQQCRNGPAVGGKARRDLL